MNNPLDPTLRELNACGGCAGTAVQTPAVIDNRPGLDALAFRAGTQPQFKATLLAALSAAARPALAPLKTREDDDFTIALLDGWATVGDVLSFYSERIANEAYLRTATERRSVLELARAIGYELKPGVAAATWLSFTIEDAVGAPGYANIAAGARVQSLPGPDEKPQVYETTEAILARHEWNELLPIRTVLPVPHWGQTTVRLKGTTTNLKPGDALLVVGDERAKVPTHPANENWDFRRVRKLETFPNPAADAAYTLVTLDRSLGTAQPFTPPARANAKVFALRLRTNVFGYNAPDWRTLPKDMRLKFGGTEGADGTLSPAEWPGFTLGEIAGIAAGQEVERLHLDGTHPTILPGGWLVVSTPDYDELYEVTAAVGDSRSGFTLNAKTTRVGVRGENLRAQFDGKVRSLTVFAQSEELDRAPEPAVEPVAGDTLTLENLIPELPVPRTLLVRGAAARVQVLPAGELQLTLASGLAVPLVVAQRLTLLQVPAPTPTSEVAAIWQLQTDAGESGWVSATLAQLAHVSAPDDAEILVEAAALRSVATDANGRTQLTLAQPLARAFAPFTTTILANVAHSTHGETVRETLGNGDASQSQQQFKLRQKPLTYVPDTSPAGAASTLEMWVNDVKWREVPTLYQRGPSERVFITRLADDGTVTVEFGDGQAGARLPGGRENIRAVYRKGIGSEGRVKAGQLSLLLTRPLGVKSVTNPLVPSEPADPQVLADARRNAPRTVLTLDRVVSLQDYEDFTRDFPGVAKALATWTWSEHTRGVLLSVLGADGRVLSETDETVRLLLAALRDAGNPLVPVQVRSAAPVAFTLRATITPAADRDPAQVLADARAALQTQFAFAARELGAGVALSEVIALLQSVAGVDLVDVDELARPGAPAVPQPAAYLVAAKPANGLAASAATAAELLLLDEAALVNVELAKP